MTYSKKIIKILISILFILLPIIDMIRRTWIKDVDIFGFSIIEFGYILIIGISFILTVFNLLKSKKELLPVLIYTVILAIYIIFHCLNILKFDQSIIPSSNINVITEIYYIFRIYYMPVLLLFVLVKNTDIFDFKYYLSIVKVLVCIICGLIIILNIFKVSFASYDATNDSFVKYNIFDFYKSSENAKMMSTRGWFDSANEISAVLIMLLPLNIYLFYKEKRKTNIFIYVIQFLAMIILGTRISAIGAIIVSFISIGINIFYKFKKQMEINYRMIICAVICTCYFFISPIGFYMLGEEKTNFNSHDEYSEYLRQQKLDYDSIKYIKNHLYQFRINEEFDKLYPVENDINFWYKIALRDRNLNNDSRIMKISIIKRVQERNNNRSDMLLGFGYTTYFMDLERDYVFQYYIFGVLGIILIIPQLILLIRSVFSYCKNILHLTYEYLFVIMSPILGLATAYFSGHVFGWVSPTYILILAIGLLYYKAYNLSAGDKNDKG